jgi:hypothetical protein
MDHIRSILKDRSPSEILTFGGGLIVFVYVISLLLFT